MHQQECTAVHKSPSDEDCDFSVVRRAIYQPDIESGHLEVVLRWTRYDQVQRGDCVELH